MMPVCLCKYEGSGASVFAEIQKELRLVNQPPRTDATRGR